MCTLNLKELPDPDTYPVVPPDMDYIYFENYTKFPFKPEVTDYSLNNLWFLSECSFLVYNHPGFARMAYKLIGFNNFKFFEGTGTECMVVWDSNSIIISFRGTELKSTSALHELRTDLDTIPVDFELGGRVHKGFNKALHEIWGGDTGLQQFLNKICTENPNAKIWITGHSLGGALAALCFAYLKSATGLVMFGSPRVGDKEFNNLFTGRNIWRVENKKDPIVLVPVNLPLIKFDFCELGQLVYINSRDKIVNVRTELTTSEHLEFVKSTISDQKKRRRSISSPTDIGKHIKSSIKEWDEYKKLFEEDTRINITDHMPIYYCSILWNNLINETIL